MSETAVVHAMIVFHLGRMVGRREWRAPTAADQARGDVGWHRRIW